jgi:hypothetical protein
LQAKVTSSWREGLEEVEAFEFPLSTPPIMVAARASVKLSVLNDRLLTAQAHDWRRFASAMNRLFFRTLQHRSPGGR